MIRKNFLTHLVGTVFGCQKVLGGENPPVGGVDSALHLSHYERHSTVCSQPFIGIYVLQRR